MTVGYASLKACVDDLRRTKQLADIEVEIDAHLEAAEIHRRVQAAGGPALFFAKVKETKFPMVSNLFGTLERAKYIFRDALEPMARLMELKADPSNAFKQPFRFASAVASVPYALPKKVRSGPGLSRETSLESLPQLKCWPNDGGAFITLPQVYTEDPEKPGWMASNLGMYRIQLSGGQYIANKEVGMHYQIHRSIGVHHQKAQHKGQSLPVAVFVGGPPAMTLSAVMPLPEGLSEVMFAGMLGRRRVRLSKCATDHFKSSIFLAAESDFCLVGTIVANKTKPEGPFGDHLGYYSLVHPFPVMRVDKVFHRADAIWPFTVVGRPPQEDTVFGQLIHELTGAVIPTVLPGVKAVHAVDAAGVHPLLLAIGQERYSPYTKLERPAELLTQAYAILGQGQLSLAKYLLIVNHHDNPALAIHDIGAFFRHLLERLDLKRDLHFLTQTNMDTLDYSGDGFNTGSKVIMAAVGKPIRTLSSVLPSWTLPDGFSDLRMVCPGVCVVKGPQHRNRDPGPNTDIQNLAQAITRQEGVVWFVVVDDAEFAARNLHNFVWVTFTRSNPAVDIFGVEASTTHKHWACESPLIIDARLKSFHAPPLESDPSTVRRVDAMAAGRGPLSAIKQWL